MKNLKISSNFLYRAVPLLILVNVIVYLAWIYSEKSEIYLEFMAENFLVSGRHLEEGKYWTLLTSVFSHNLSIHILLNMLVLNSFGPIIERLFGFIKFLRFYLLAGVISSISHVLVSNIILHNPEIPALGASGAISGVLLLFCLIFPKEKILIMGLIPVPAIIGAFIFMGLDIWGLIAQAEGSGLPIGHGAHLGGSLTGLLYYFLIRRKLKRSF